MAFIRKFFKGWLVLMAVFSYLKAAGQSQAFHFSPELATFQMGHLKDVMQDNLNSGDWGNVPVKLTSDYPAFPGYFMGYDYPITKDGLSLGVSLGINSTGARIHYADFSGEIDFSHAIESFNFGVVLTKQVNATTQKTSFYLGLEARLIQSQLRVASKLRIGEVSDVANIEFVSTSLAGMPFAKLSRPIYQRFHGHLKLGYLIDFQADLKWRNDKSFVFFDSNRNTVKADWSGLRLSLGASYVF